jgi:hypothetical protein
LQRSQALLASLQNLQCHLQQLSIVGKGISWGICRSRIPSPHYNLEAKIDPVKNSATLNRAATWTFPKWTYPSKAAGRLVQSLQRTTSEVYLNKLAFLAPRQAYSFTHLLIYAILKKTGGRRWRILFDLILNSLKRRILT